MHHSTEKRRIQRGLTKLLLRHPFWGALALQLELRASSARTTTACTDGVAIEFNEDFIRKIHDDHLPMVLAEEVGHCALGHLWRAPAGADPKVWNQACDQEIRWMLQDENTEATRTGKPVPFLFPDGDTYLPDPQYKGMAAEAVYAALTRKAQGPPPGPPKSQNPNPKPPAPSPTPPPPTPQPSAGGGSQPQPPTPGSGPGAPGPGQPGQGQPGPGGPGHGAPSEEAPRPGALGEFTQPAGPGSSESERESLRQDWDRKVLTAARMAKGRGSLPGAIARRVEEIVHPKEDPFQAMRECLTERAAEDFNFLRPNARYADTGFFLPSLDSPKAGRIVFATDTSGSIDDELLARMRGLKQWTLDEIKPTALVDIYCDARVKHVAEYLPGDEIGTEAPGGGGTNFCPVFAHVAADDTGEPVRALVYLTDLDGTFPDEEPPYPVLWVTWDPRREAPFGRVIRVEP